MKEVVRVTWRAFLRPVRQPVLGLALRGARAVRRFPLAVRGLRWGLRRFPALELWLKARMFGHPQAAALLVAADAEHNPDVQLADHAVWIHDFIVRKRAPRSGMAQGLPAPDRGA